MASAKNNIKVYKYEKQNCIYPLEFLNLTIVFSRWNKALWTLSQEFFFSLCSKKPKQHQSTPPQQKPLTLAYDGDLDM